ncbi:MAG: HEAT repeat domain-containing protein, partial [Prochlorococcus sp.]
GRAIPVLIKALSCDDEIAVINAIDSITKIDTPLTDEQTQAIGLALTGPDNQKRAVIQAHTRLGLPDPNDAIRPLEEHDNPLVAGAACVYAARSEGRTEQLNRLIPQLTDPKAGRRHAAVIDLGDAGDVSWLEPLIRAPVSMPLRAKSAFKLLQTNGNGDIPEQYIPLLEQLLQDNPNNLDLKDEWIAAEDPAELEKNLQHRDEAKQYGAAKTLISLERSQAMVVIDDLQKKFGSDYVIHYYLTVAVSLGRIHERSDLIRASLAATIPQYAKSRVAAAWGCLNLQLSDQIPLLRELAEGSEWIPLKWSCKQVLHKISESG